MKLHFVGLPHTTVSREYEWCAYTQKLLHMLQICNIIGYEALVYEFNTKSRDEYFGDTFTSENPPVFNEWNPEAECWKAMNAQVVDQIKSEIAADDIICIIAGRCQEEIKNAFPFNICLEWAIGYDGILDDTYKCFESNIWRHYVYGKYGINSGRFYDTVIPNS